MEPSEPSSGDAAAPWPPHDDADAMPSSALTTTTSTEIALLDTVDDQMTAFARSTITFTDKMASGFVKFLIFYAMLCCHVVRTIGHVPSCGDAERAAGRCARPWAAGAVDVFVFASMSGDPKESRGKAPVYAARNVTTLDASFAVPVPAAVRTRGGAVLHAHVFVAPPRHNATWEPRNDTTLASSAYCVGSVELTRPAKVASRRDRPRSLLEGEREEDEDADQIRPHWKFTTWAPVLRLLDVGGDGALPSRVAREGLPNLGVAFDVRERRGSLAYMPAAFLDETLVLEKHARPMSRNVSHPDPTMRFAVATHGPLHFGLRATVAAQLLGMAKTVLPELDVDDLRYQISDARIFKYFVSQAIAVLHVGLDYCAFSEDVGFYVGRETFHGVSASTLLWALARDLILYLYLQDAEAGKIVLLGLFMTLVGDFFKIQRVLKPTLVLRRSGLLVYPAFVTAPLKQPKAKATAKYDAEASRHLYLATYPLLFGVAWYSLVHDKHKAYYSWAVSSLADLVYYFGFVMMTPQLYINYKLQSVAHLPVKSFAYKIFNTFIDDAFAFVVDMPLKHRLMTLRDDVVFLIFLYQWYTYRVDKTRANEFGRAYEGAVADADGPGGDAAAVPDPKEAVEEEEEEDDDDGYCADG